MKSSWVVSGVAIAVAFLASSFPLWAQVSDSGLSQVGLVTAWRGQINQAPQAGEPISLTVFPHPTKRKQVVVVYSNGRVVERIDGNMIDRVEYEKRMTDIRSIDKANQTAVEVPRIGLQGALAMAQQTEKRFQKAKLPVNVVTEKDQPITYLVTTSKDGTIQAFDAETGESLWTKAVGNSNLPTLPSGVSERYVTAINGSNLYVMELETGVILNQRRISGVQFAGSFPVGDWVFVSGFNGSLIGYHATDTSKLTWRAVSGGHGTAMPVLSADSRFMAWNADPKYVYLARVDDRLPRLWNRFESKEFVRSQPVPVENGFVVATSEGGVTYIEIPNDKNPKVRNDAVKWRTNSEIPNPKPPVVGQGLVLVTSEFGELVALSEETGEYAWQDRIPGISTVLSVSPSNIYCRSRNNRLVVLDAKSGTVAKSTSVNFPHAITNHVNDRIYFVTSEGQITCAREIALKDPMNHLKIVPPSSTKSKPTPPKATPSPNGSEDMFGTSSEPNGLEPTAPSSDAGDPFGGPKADPFGGNDGGGANGAGAMPSDNPFGN